MNKYDIERFETLNNIKSNTGRHRAWLRSCLNEHCLERFTIAVLANQSLTNQFYEEWAFLLDKSYNSSLPVLISGLESILFAINIDNSNLNIPSKILNASSATSIGIINLDSENKPIEAPLSSSYSESTVKINKKVVNNINSKKIKKINVVLDKDELNELKKSPPSVKSEFSPNRILVNPINYISPAKSISDADTASLNKKISESSDVFEPENDAIVATKTDTNGTRLTNSTSAISLKDTAKIVSDPNDISTDSSADTDIYK